MRFTKPFWAGIADESVTVAFRRWAKPTVVAGRPYRTGGGRVEVLSVDEIDVGAITKADAKRAGYASVADVLAALPDESDRLLYRVRFGLITDPDPRETLANNATLSATDVAEIDARLDRLDKASKAGAWTRSTLRLIEERPAIRAPDLAESVGRETKAFKLDVRKLKNLGLTTSLKIGYQLSPRGHSYLHH